jgi:DNA-binding GntR family transcriptional regulator
MFAESRDDRDPELYELGQSIYSLVAEASGNRLLASFVSALSQVTVPVYMRELRPDEAEAARDRSRSLVDAIDRKDSLAAEAAMSAQLAPMQHHVA